MTLKIQVNGVKKRIMTSLVTFVNGSKVHLSSGYTFVNGEKVQLWGNTLTDLTTLGYRFTPFNDEKILYFDDTRLLWFGTGFMRVWVSSGGNAMVRTSTTPTGGGGYWTNIQQSNLLTLLDIEDPSTENKISTVTWGTNPVFSPSESSDTEYVYYLQNGATRNRVIFNNETDVFGVSATYTISGTSSSDTFYWCVPLDNGDNLWVKYYQGKLV